METFLLLLAAFLVLLNGFFVAAEFAIVKVRATRLEELEKKGVRASRVARTVRKDLDAYLSATQLGITLASLGLGWIGEPAVAHILRRPLEWLGLSETALHSVSLAVAFTIITAAHIVLGELAPKSLAILRPERTTLVVAAPLRVFYWVFFPFIWVLNHLARALLRTFGLSTAEESDDEHAYSEAELRMLLGRSKVLSPERVRVVQRALSLESRTAHQMMIPRSQVVSLGADMDLDEARAVALETTHGRFPVTEDGELDTAIGIVALRDLLEARLRGRDVPVRELAKPTFYVPQSAPTSRILEALQQHDAPMALVVDEHGGVAGIVTLADVVRELLGPMPEDQRVRATLVPAEGSVTMDGATPLHQLAERAGVVLEGPAPATIAGYLMRVLERFPRIGDRATLGSYKLVVEGIEGSRVTRVRVTPLQPRGRAPNVPIPSST